MQYQWIGNRKRKNPKSIIFQWLWRLSISTLIKMHWQHTMSLIYLKFITRNHLSRASFILCCTENREVWSPIFGQHETKICFFLFHVRKHCFPTVQHKGVASWIEKEEEWGGGGRRWVVTMELGSLLEKQTQKNGSLGKSTLFISLRLTKIQWLESIWSTSPNKMSLQSIQQSFVNTFRIYLKKNSFSLQYFFSFLWILFYLKAWSRQPRQ